MTPYTQFYAGNDGGAFEISNATFRDTDGWLYDALTGGIRSDAGVPVNGYTALTWCPLWQGVNIIAGDIGQVPIRLVKDEFTDQKRHNAWQLLRVQPNQLQTPSVWMETMIQWALIWGNAVAWTPRVGSRIEEMIPLRPDCLRPELIESDGYQTILYHYHSIVTNKEYTFFPYDVVHIQGLTSDGIWGYPLHQIGKNTIGFGLSLQKHGNRQFANGARPSGVLEHPAKLDTEARRHLREEWDKIHGGANNSGKIAILWEGMKFNATSMSNVDAQWVQAMEMSAVDAARLLNLPAYKLNAQDSMGTKSNLEEQSETYKQMTLTRLSNRLDQEFRRKLLTDAEWKSDRFKFVFDWDAFMQADIDTRSTVADRMVKSTMWNPNEGRAYMRYPPREGGEVYGNPATSKGPEDGAESPDNGRPKGATTENAHRELLLDRTLHLLERENNIVAQTAKAGANFVNWLDEFYIGVDGGTPKLFGVVEAVMGASVRACCATGLDARGITNAIACYAKTRHAQLLEVCSNVNKNELPAAIEKQAGENTTLVAQGLLATALGELHGTENNKR